MFITYGTTSHIIFVIFLIISLGYLLGSISIKKVSLGTAAVFVAALIIGTIGSKFPNSILCIDMPSIVQNIGVVLFVTSVGVLAGNNFFSNIKKSAVSYAMVGMICVLVGISICILLIKFGNVDSSLAVGLLSGALTSTPGYSAAQEVVNNSESLMSNVAVGHGIAYPFGVLAVVIFVQIMPRLSSVNEYIYNKDNGVLFDIKENDKEMQSTREIDKWGVFQFSLAIVLGIIVGSIKVPLFNDSRFSLGNTGGALFLGIITGSIKSIGKYDMKCDSGFLNVVKEIGLVLFLVGSGYEGGKKFLEVVSGNGILLFVYGAIMTIVPMVCAYLFAKYVLHMKLYDNLGSITGGMTSTPALGALVEIADVDVVTNAYATTYPFALIFVVLGCQLVIMLL